MALDSQRILAGTLDVSISKAVLYIDVGPYSDVSLQAVPRYNPTLGSWDASIKQDIAGTPVAFTSAINFTSSTLYRTGVDTSAISRLVITNDTAGTSGLVDIWLIGKSV